jgi:hypothetical protein
VQGLEIASESLCVREPTEDICALNSRTKGSGTKLTQLLSILNEKSVTNLAADQSFFYQSPVLDHATLSRAAVCGTKAGL